MIIFANSKINLGLFVQEKRADGFHEISSLMVPIPYADNLEILPAESYELVLIGKEIQGNLQDNLITRAFRLMERSYDIPPVKIVLDKLVAMGAGLGGGSADAAFVLKGLNDFFELNLGEERLKSLAAELGSDCPFFIANQPQIARGRGEVLQPFDLSLKGLFLHLICPGYHVGTAEAYAGVRPKRTEFDWNALNEKDWTYWQQHLKNDFEPSVFAKWPQLGTIKQRLYDEGAVYASMSGSGSSMFGLYTSA
ncbi:unnamed protein product, partial [Chrysoparadoxa australica]